MEGTIEGLDGPGCTCLPHSPCSHHGPAMQPRAREYRALTPADAMLGPHFRVSARISGPLAHAAVDYSLSISQRLFRWLWILAYKSFQLAFSLFFVFLTCCSVGQFPRLSLIQYITIKPYPLPGTILGMGNAAIARINKSPVLMGLF